MSSFKLMPADYLTLARLLSVPVLWALALSGEVVVMGVVLAVAGTTDVLDGPVARRFGASRFGGQMDSLADILLMASIFWWFVILTPEFFLDNATPLVVWAFIGTTALLATYIKFGRFGNLHLYSAKTAGVAGYLFAVSHFILGTIPILFHVAVTLALIGATETLLVALTRRRVDDRVGSILLRTGGG